MAEPYEVDVIVIGAGMGGLSAAITAAAAGLSVRVVEAASGPGGKMGVASSQGVEFDTGPSLLTMTDVVERVFALAGSSLRDELELVTPSPMFRYLYPDGVCLDIFHGLPQSVQSIHQCLGPKAAREFEQFMAYSRDIWQAARHNFIEGPAPNITSMVKLGATKLRQVMAIDPLRSMWQGIERHVSDPHLRTLLARYATYNGSNPYEAPATLNCIAWVEQGLGGYGIKGGMAQLPRALERVARRQGVELSYQSPVAQIEVDRQGRAHGVTLASGQRLLARAVIANADVAHVIDALLPKAARHDLPRAATLSMSGWTAVLRAQRSPALDRAAHTVIFPQDYAREFDDIFGAQRPPQDPTVYLCAQSRSHLRPGWGDQAEPVFLMANAPPEPEHGQRDDAPYEALRERVLARVRQAGLMLQGDELVWERLPRQLAATFAGSRGSIYGAASNSQLAAFRRPPNAVASIPGLYLASGSAHPGGGVPLCLMSGLTAAEAACRDLDRGHALAHALRAQAR